MSNTYRRALCALLLILPLAALGGEPDGKDGGGHAGTSPDLRWQFAYDDAGRLRQSVDPSGRTTRFLHDLDKLE